MSRINSLSLEIKTISQREIVFMCIAESLVDCDALRSFGLFFLE